MSTMAIFHQSLLNPRPTVLFSSHLKRLPGIVRAASSRVSKFCTAQQLGDGDCKGWFIVGNSDLAGGVES